MAHKFSNTLYLLQKVQLVDGELRYIENADGTVFSNMRRTKITPEILPEWFIPGTYHRCKGFLSTKGITDLRYIPNTFSNHFLKDDWLLIAYGGTITDTDCPEASISLADRYEGWDEFICGNEIITVLRGARKYSDFDITPLIEKLRWKRDWMKKKFPDEFGPETGWDVDIDKLFAEDEQNTE